MLRRGSVTERWPAVAAPARGRALGVVPVFGLARTIVLGVRPQDVVVSQDERSDQNAIEAEVFTVEPLGDSTILDLKIGETRMKAVTSPDFHAEMGGKVWARFRADRVYLFDKKSGDAVG